jgi:hypothetical protein
MFQPARQSLAPPKKNWLRGLDLNQRPSGYEPDELPGCSTPRDHYGEMMRGIKLKAGYGPTTQTGKGSFVRGEFASSSSLFFP